MPRLAALLFILALAACSTNAADTAAQKATHRPLTASLEFLSPGPNVYLKKPASLTDDQTDETTLYDAPLANALVKLGYAQSLYKAHCYDNGRCDGEFWRAYGLTDKGKSVGWVCKPADDSDKGTTCDIAIGTMQPGAAKIEGGSLFLDVTPIPNEIGKALTGNLTFTNWNGDCHGLQFGTKSDCRFSLGPDGVPVR